MVFLVHIWQFDMAYLIFYIMPIGTMFAFGQRKMMLVPIHNVESSIS
jgi:hypothetical protein